MLALKVIAGRPVLINDTLPNNVKNTKHAVLKLCGNWGNINIVMATHELCMVVVSSIHSHNQATKYNISHETTIYISVIQRYDNFFALCYL